MLKVGLTGGLASGKSFVAACFAEQGARIIQADALGHEALNGEAREEVLAEFGARLARPDGSIDRKALAAIVFGDPAKLAKLNALIHPRVFARQERFFAEVEREDPRAAVVVEAAVMIEAGSHRRYDRLVVAACPPETQIQRFMAREGATEAQARQRLDRQLPLSEKVKLADYVIDTSGTKEETARQARAIYAKLKAEAEARS